MKKLSQTLILAVAVSAVNYAAAQRPDSISAGGLPDESLRVHAPESTGAGIPQAMPDNGVGSRSEVYVPSLGYGKISGAGMMPFETGLRVNPGATRLPPMGYIPGFAMIQSWGNGGIFATGGSRELVGLMGIETGALNFQQRVGAFTLSLFGSATKYGYFHGLSTTYGFGGSLSYDINEHLGVTVFGAYHSASGISQAAMMGYVSAPTFGGYLDWRFSSHWGVKVGAQSYRSIAFGRWETQPIVMPYYRTSGGAEIGVDVGGILYQVVRSASGGSWGNPGNPTIDPRPSGVYVRPRD